MYKIIKSKYAYVYLLIIILVIVILGRAYYSINTNTNTNTNTNIGYKKEINKFDDVVASTTKYDIATAPTPENKNTTCTNSTDIINVCMNYQNCCSSSSANPISKCFCTHPFVKNCNDAYNKCIETNKTSNETSNNIPNHNCDSILNECCSKYSNIDINNSNFKKPINASQSSNQICTLNGVANLSQKCMELCQTNPLCKAYSIILGGCTLYDDINYNNGKNGNYYVIKK